MKKFKTYILFSCLYVLFGILAIPVYAQQYSIKGRIIDGTTMKNVGFAIVIVKEAGIVVNAPAGNYYAELPRAGTYTVQVQSEGLQTVTVTVTVSGSVSRDFTLNPFASKGKGVVIKGERVIQKISRRTMKVDEIKDVPASFGDSVNALTSMPGVIRTSGGGFFGPLVIRGADPVHNRYYIDGMPVDNPLHFGDVHSVISNELMSEIDLYSSSFTSDFGGPIAAVININTVDEVERFGGWADVGLISASALISSPITSVVRDEEGKEKTENRGYIIASGRVGYLSLLVPLFYEIVMGEKLENIPEYWDYQFKARYRTGSRSSLTLLCLGSRDYWKVLVEDEEVDEESGEDPLFTDLKLDYDQCFHNQGIYYTYDNMKFRNTFMVYSAWSRYDMYFDVSSLPEDHWLRDFDVKVNPWITGARNSFRWKWGGDFAELRGAVESTYYKFNAKGDSLRVTQAGYIDPSDPDAFDVTAFDLDFNNLVLGTYLEQRFTRGGLVIMPSVRSEWLRGTGYVTADPRGLISFRFNSGTTVSAAGGHYSSFFQTNPYVFQYDPTYASQGDSLEPEKAWHCALGAEQVIDRFTGSLELFYNYFYDLVEAYPHEEDGTEVPGINSGKQRACGAEFLVKLESGERDGFFGWGSYTFTMAERKSGLPVSFDVNGDEWRHSAYEQQHSVKIVSGYRRGQHSLSGRFQLYSSFPYTPVNASYESPPGSGRYQPVYDMDRFNEKHLTPSHQLDLRYTRRTGYEWGYLSWYVEVINVYGPFNREKEYRWRYDRPYSRENPEIVESDSALSLIPNFGVEVKF